MTKKIKPFSIFVCIIVFTLIVYYIYLEYSIYTQNQLTDNMNTDLSSPELIKLYELSGYDKHQFDKFILSIIDNDNDTSLKKKKRKLLEGISSSIFTSMVVCIINGEYHSPLLILSSMVNNITSMLTKVFF